MNKYLSIDDRKVKTKSFKIDPTTEKMLDQLAIEDNRSCSNMIRQLIIEEYERKHADSEQK